MSSLFNAAYYSIDNSPSTIDAVEGGKRHTHLPFNLGRIEGEELEEQRFEDVRDKMSLPVLRTEGN